MLQWHGVLQSSMLQWHAVLQSSMLQAVRLTVSQQGSLNNESASCLPGLYGKAWCLELFAKHGAHAGGQDVNLPAELTSGCLPCKLAL